MKTIFLDFETFYSDEYSLRRMTPVEYILDPRFEVNGLAALDSEHFSIATAMDPVPSARATWIDGPDVGEYFKSLDPSQTNLVTHNALFDMCIVAWRYGFIPRLMGCTMSIARAVLGHQLRYMSLDSVAKHLGLGSKGSVIHKVKGMTLPMIQQAELYNDYVSYGKDDVWKCAGIYDKLVKSGHFPLSELFLLDMVLRCAVQPRFRLCPDTLAEHLAAVRAEKAQLLAQAMLLGANGAEDLRSNDKFAECLRMLGVDPPMKISLVTGQPAYAFAKSDEGFMELMDHENEGVQTLVAARLNHKSTLEESRSERFQQISSLVWPITCTGNMPVPLRYSGAHTHRLSGDWSLNMQNLRRGGKLRRALLAPSGHQVLKIDSSQVEARGVAVLCGQQDLVDAFAAGKDVYSEFATEIFQKPVNKKDNPNERFVGKEGILSLGYGAGAPKYQSRVKFSSKEQTGTPIILPDEEAARIVNTYRKKYFRVPAGWNILNHDGIPALQTGSGFQFGPCIFEKEAVLLPSGLRLFYHNLMKKDGEWWFEYGGTSKKLYGGKLLENITQALARIVVMEAAARIRKRLAPFALQAHDELVYIVPNEQVEEAKVICMEEMCRRPVWLPEWPLAAELGVGPNYGDCR